MTRFQLPPVPKLEEIISPDSPLLPADPLLPWWGWTLVALALAGVLWWVIHKLRNRPQIPEDSRDVALRGLTLLEGEMQNLAPYEFTIRVCDVLRRYVEQRFELPATSQTSEEFLHDIQGHAGFVREEKELLGAFLARCDAIKFAQATATADDNRQLLDSARHFVKGGPA